MKFKIVLAILSLLAVIPAKAEVSAPKENKFYFSNQVSQNWKVHGDDDGGIWRCSASSHYEDGSTFQITKNIATCEIYFMIQNTDWSLTPDETKVINNGVQINAYTAAGKFVIGSAASVIIVEKNMLKVPSITPKSIVDLLGSKADRLRIIPNGSAVNWTVRFDNAASKILNAFGECAYQGMEAIKQVSPKKGTKI
jgi:hypothetical protein